MLKSWLIRIVAVILMLGFPLLAEFAPEHEEKIPVPENRRESLQPVENQNFGVEACFPGRSQAAAPRYRRFLDSSQSHAQAPSASVPEIDLVSEPNNPDNPGCAVDCENLPCPCPGDPQPDPNFDVQACLASLPKPTSDREGRACLTALGKCEASTIRGGLQTIFPISVETPCINIADPVLVKHQGCLRGIDPSLFEDSDISCSGE